MVLLWHARPIGSSFGMTITGSSGPIHWVNDKLRFILLPQFRPRVFPKKDPNSLLPKPMAEFACWPPILNRNGSSASRANRPRSLSIHWVSCWRWRRIKAGSTSWIATGKWSAKLPVPACASSGVCTRIGDAAGRCRFWLAGGLRSGERRLALARYPGGEYRRDGRCRSRRTGCRGRFLGRNTRLHQNRSTLEMEHRHRPLSNGEHFVRWFPHRRAGNGRGTGRLHRARGTAIHPAYGNRAIAAAMNAWGDTLYVALAGREVVALEIR